MEKENLNIGIELTQLQGAVRQQGWVCIPESQLNVFNDRVYLNLTAWAMPSNPYGKSHIVKQHVNKDTYESMSEEQRRNMPIVGGIKPMMKNEQ